MMKAELKYKSNAPRWKLPGIIALIDRCKNPREWRNETNLFL